jgi:hypothetical protein
LAQFWFIAVGYLFVAVNVQINGLGLYLPTCFGHASIAIACWSMRDRQSVFRYAAFASAILAVLTFPSLFSGSIAGHLSGYYSWTFWPWYFLYLSSMVLVSMGIWFEANLKGIDVLKTFCHVLILVIFVSQTIWWFTPLTGKTLYLTSALLQVVPALYLSVLCAAAARKFT